MPLPKVREEPVQTIVVKRRRSSGVIRRWGPGAAPGCGRCSEPCNLKVGADGIGVCYVEYKGAWSELAGALAP